MFNNFFFPKIVWFGR